MRKIEDRIYALSVSTGESVDRIKSLIKWHTETSTYSYESTLRIFEGASSYLPDLLDSLDKERKKNECTK